MPSTRLDRLRARRACSRHRPEGRHASNGKPKKRGGRRLAVECACEPPRKLHMTPKQIEDGPVICGVCTEPFEAPEDSDQDEAGEDRP